MRQNAAGNVFRPAMDIVDDAMFDNVCPNDVVLPKKPLLKRVANRFHAKKRPQEPRDIDFDTFITIQDSYHVSLSKQLLSALGMSMSINVLY